MVKAFEQHCTVVKAEKGKKKRLKCNFCNEVFSGITRIVVHLSGAKGKKGAEATSCKKVPAEVRQAALKHLNLDSQKRPHDDDEEEDDDDVMEVSGPAPKRRGSMGSALGSSSAVQTPITSYTHQLRHTEAHDAISSFLFECGIPFNVTRHPAWHEMWDAVRKAGPNLRPLSYNTYRTTALKKVNTRAFGKAKEMG